MCAPGHAFRPLYVYLAAPMMRRVPPLPLPLYTLTPFLCPKTEHVALVGADEHLFSCSYVCYQNMCTWRSVGTWQISSSGVRAAATLACACAYACVADTRDRDTPLSQRPVCQVPVNAYTCTQHTSHIHTPSRHRSLRKRNASAYSTPLCRPSLYLTSFGSHSRPSVLIWMARPIR